MCQRRCNKYCVYIILFCIRQVSHLKDHNCNTAKNLSSLAWLRRNFLVTKILGNLVNNAFSKLRYYSFSWYIYLEGVSGKQNTSALNSLSMKPKLGNPYQGCGQGLLLWILARSKKSRLLKSCQRLPPPPWKNLKWRILDPYSILIMKWTLIIKSLKI